MPCRCRGAGALALLALCLLVVALSATSVTSEATTVPLDKLATTTRATVPAAVPTHPNTGGAPSAASPVSVAEVREAEATVRLLLNRANDDLTASSSNSSTFASHLAWFGPRLLLSVLRFFGYTALVLVFTLWWFQGSLLYMPAFGRANEPKQTARNTKGYQSPAEYGLPFEECWIDAAEDGTRTHAWLILQPDPMSAPTILFFHGNAGNIGYRLPNAKSLYHTTRANVMLVEYRGYGHCAGEPTEAGLRMDALAALRFLREHRRHTDDDRRRRPEIDLSRLYLFGRSLGGAVAIATAYDDQRALDAMAASSIGRQQVHPPLAGLLVENTFSTLLDMVLVLAGRLGAVRHSESGPPGTGSSLAQRPTLGARFLRVYLNYLMTNRWTSLPAITHLRTPILFLSGLADELIPSSQMAALHSAATRSRHRQMYTVANGTHNDTYVRGGLAYYEAVDAFLRKTSAMATSASAGEQERDLDAL